MSVPNRITIWSLLLLMSGALAWPQARDEEPGPAAPDNLRVFTRYDGATAVAELIWKDNSEDELGFEVLRSDDNEEFRVVGIVGTNTDHYEDKIGQYVTGVYAYRVRAFNAAGRSSPSNTITLWF